MTETAKIDTAMEPLEAALRAGGFIEYIEKLPELFRTVDAINQLTEKNAKVLEKEPMLETEDAAKFLGITYNNFWRRKEACKQLGEENPIPAYGKRPQKFKVRDLEKYRDEHMKG